VGKATSDLLRFEAFQSRPVRFEKSLAPRVSGGPKQLQLLGRLEIRRLGMSVLVVEGDGDQQLRIAAGHVPGTAWVDQNGNTAIAGHRDTAFFPLRELRVGDVIDVRSNGTYKYIVKTIRIVAPDDVSVLRETTKQELTLITCYPFRFIGDAPKRLIAEAERKE